MNKNSTIKPLYPYTPWEVIEGNFDVENNYRNETIFSLANGFIGTRGTFEEGYTGPDRTGIEGTFINGFYESEIIKYGEKGFGYADKSQTMLNVTNGKVIKLYIDGEAFDMLEGTVKEYKRILDLKNGSVIRTVLWESPKGKQVSIATKRFVSMTDKQLMVIEYQVQPIGDVKQVKIVSMLDGDVLNSTTETNARIDYGPYERVLLMENQVNQEGYLALLQRTKHTKFVLATTAENVMTTDNVYVTSAISDTYHTGIAYEIEVKDAKPITFHKYVGYVTSLEYPEDQLLALGKEIVSRAKVKGYEALEAEQRAFYDEFWTYADVEIEGDDGLQQGIRFNIFHLLQSTGRDGRTSVGAKGLSGEGYEGHCFWDTEMYALPFFLYNSPQISKKLIEYRYNTLDQARERARQMSHKKGALYPWRTINGEETSPYFPVGTAQYHINGDIAFAISKYYEVTQDEEFYKKYCIEILWETARFWEDMGVYLETKDNKFCINGVTGPDEYTAMVNNNYYTNLLAKENLLNAYKGAKFLQETDEKYYHDLMRKIRLDETEIAGWKKAADAMYFPYSEELGIYPQDDSFIYKKKWDIENTAPDKFPLLDNHHPLVLYRHQVCKQADLILALFLMSHQYNEEDLKRNFDYYEGITVHESSLSACIFSIMASQIKYHDKAYDYFMDSARLDLDDYHQNTKAGIHMANLAGTWMCIVNGFAGMRVYEDAISFAPYLPKNWKGYSFKVRYRGRVIKVDVKQEGANYTLLEGEGVEIVNHGNKIIIKK